jgi:hypothetical protein
MFSDIPTNKIICTHRQNFLFNQDEWNSPFKKEAELLGNKNVRLNFGLFLLK